MKIKLFYISGGVSDTGNHYEVKHRQLTGKDTVCAVFHARTIGSKSRALKAAKVFCNQMNTYYPPIITKHPAS